MIRKVYLTLAVLLITYLGSFAQSGTIKGKIYDKATKEPLAFASVVAEINGTQAGGSQSDFDGNYSIKPLQPGRYNVRISYVGYLDYVINDVTVSIDKITFVDLPLTKKVIETKEVQITEFKNPLIDKGNTQVGATLTREEIEQAPTRDVKSVVALSAGVLQKDEGDDINIRGSRSSSTDYYIDGVRVRGSTKLPQAGIEQATVIVGGTPAQYGDATGGIVSITTRGPSSEFNGGLEYVTSELFDKFGYNLVSANLSGPILLKKLENGNKRSILGFFVSGEYQFEKDPDPSAIGIYKLKSDAYNQLATNPVQPYQTGSPTDPLAWGAFNTASYFHASDFEKVKTKDNIEQKGLRFTSKIDFQPLENTTFTLGGSFNLNDRSSYTLNRSVYNSAENPQIKDTDWRVFARVTQRIASTYRSESDKSASILRNVYFSLQAEYSKNQQVNQDPTHKDNFWNYGYFGKFTNNRTRTFAFNGSTYDSTTNSYYNDSVPVYSNAYTFDAVGVNPLTEQYNIVADNAWHNAGFGAYTDLNQIRGPGGLRNGDAPASVDAIWEGIGNARNLYQNFDNDQFRFSFTMNADIKNHQLRFGAEFEQRVDRGYSLAPRGLWTIGRSLENFNFLALDRSNLIDSTITQTNDSTYGVNYNYAQGYTGNVNTKGFYENLRDALGLPYNSYVDIDALSPSQLNIGMFTPDELLTNNVLGYYYGFDYTGKKISGNPSFKDFFTKQKNGVYSREIGAFRPSYSAFYLQDNFAIENLNFNVGVRIDRFDANQKVLKDPYLLLDSYHVNDLPGGIVNKPDNIGGNYVPYLAVEGDYTSIIGYRNGSVWYDVDGNIVSDPDLIARKSSSGRIIAAVKPTAGSIATSDWDIDAVFKDYDPQISIMPRVAFAFSITDQAQFFAHYDVLTERPSGQLRNDPTEYLSLVTNPDGTLNNAGLKPERTTDYELGFKQVLSKASAITISAFYRELKNQIQITKFYFAIPNTYTSYGNIDFGTVKGLSLSYDLRRTANVRLLASYTLQFADGTGSGPNSNVELTNTDQPNIRFIIPLDFDQRHQFSASIDYRYGEGSAYNGPLVWGKPIFANAGANIVFKANSGTPYTRQARPTREGAAIGWQSNGQRVVDGVINSARTPWQFRVDLRLDKDINLKFSEKKSATLNIYFQVQNVLDIRNIIAVYRATGNPDDDGFIYSPDGVQLAAAQPDSQAFIDQYLIKIQNPDNYSLPRRARLGVRFDF